MQTFLPYSDFAESAKCLDRKRLGKQRVECLQILKALTEPGYGWQHHPAVAMWRGHEHCLADYGIAICHAWRRLGYADTCTVKIMLHQDVNAPPPSWLGDERLHASHRAALLSKDPSHYSQFNWKEEPRLDYFWPTKEFAQ